jgi:hypothetical protein
MWKAVKTSPKISRKSPSYNRKLLDKFLWQDYLPRQHVLIGFYLEFIDLR